ncbi:TasA family protein [Haloterrigena salinisoli]|uniref:TasA family protein n=1 Tax=Haloterrigena salinisoli TaxID=3132747 RepID=UPI0030D185B9
MSDNTFDISRRKVLGSIGLIGAGSAAAGAGTMAYFSDTEESTGNTVSAGTLDLELSTQANAPISVPDAKPGDTGNAVWQLNNAGSIDGGDIELDVINVVSLENGYEDPEPVDDDGDGELDDYLKVEVGIDPDYANDTDLGDGDENDVLSKANIHTVASNGPQSAEEGLSTSETKYLYVKWEFPNNGNQNDAQGDQVTFDVEVALKQN